MSEKKMYILHLTGRRAVCPICAGMAPLQEELDQLWCVDCASVFTLEDIGRSDKEMVCMLE